MYIMYLQARIREEIGGMANKTKSTKLQRKII